MPKGRYNGQKLIKLVSRNTAAKITSTSPNTPETVPVKYNKAIVAARIMRMMRSAAPMFFFIVGRFYFLKETMSQAKPVATKMHNRQTTSILAHFEPFFMNQNYR